MRVQDFPAPGMKVPASEFIITGGGCAANAAVTIARLDGRAAFAGPLGGPDDTISSRILADLGKEGIDCGGVVRVRGGSASVSLILLDARGEKTIATRRGINLGDTLPQVATKLVADVDAVLVDNRFPHFVFEVCRADACRSRCFPEVELTGLYFFDGHGAPQGAQAPAKSSGDTARPLDGLERWSTKIAATPTKTTRM